VIVRAHHILPCVSVHIRRDSGNCSGPFSFRTHRLGSPLKFACRSAYEATLRFIAEPLYMNNARRAAASSIIPIGSSDERTFSDAVERIAKVSVAESGSLDSTCPPLRCHRRRSLGNASGECAWKGTSTAKLSDRASYLPEKRPLDTKPSYDV